jgi:hypothetical protein
MEQLGYHMADFHEILYLNIFISKIRQDKRVLYMKTGVRLLQYFA